MKCLTCSYREPLPGELSFDEIKQLARQLKTFGLRHIVYSGGEPLLRRDFKQICELFASPGVKQTLLTNGLLLEKRADDIKDYFAEIIVSLDGAVAETHNKIRGINSFDLILKGIEKVIDESGIRQVSIRSVLQKQNFRQLPKFIDLAKSLNVNRISFLSADVTSDAFGRDTRGAAAPESDISLSKDEVNEFREIANKVITDYKAEFETGLISETPEKLLKLVNYYGALCGQNPYPKNYCNAPMVSAVITSTGNIQPCYFIPAFGNVRGGEISELANKKEVQTIRNEVRNFTHPRCETCVCTLNVSK
ncbi:MAG TPA: radical SAM protein, partial [Ignavibacteria bacterium]